MKPISQQTHDNIISLLNNGLSSRQIAAQLGISHTTVNTVRAKKVNQDTRNKGGRPAKLKAADKRELVRLITSRKANTVTQLVKELKDTTKMEISTSHPQGCWNEGSNPLKKPKLQPHHIKQCLDFALRHKYWTIDDWKRVIWSDETKINLLGSDGRQWIWKKSDGGRLKDQQIQGTVKFGGGSLMFWGCMTSKGIGYGCRIDGNMDAQLYVDILDDHLLQTIRYYKLDRDKVIFQQDNDSKHTSHLAHKWFEENGIEVLDWPPQSPDLSPIEHIFEHLKRKLAEYEFAPSGILELWERVEVEWDKITADVCINLIESIPRRIAAVLKARGGYTKY